MLETLPRRRPSFVPLAVLAALVLAIAAALVGVGPIHRVTAAPCAPGEEPSPAPSGVPECEAPLDPDGSDHATDSVTSGGTVTTDGSHDQATPGDPVETRVVPSNAAVVTIDEIPPTLAAPAGYTVIGQQLDIATADAGPPSDRAIQIAVYLDATIWPGVDPSAIRVARDGLLVPECDNRSVVASPDPCELFFTTLLQGDDRWITIWTNSGASSWLFVVAGEFSTGTVPAEGGTVGTDTEFDGATPADPIETSVQSPVEGSVSITEGSPSGGPPADFLFVGQEITIEAPFSTFDVPLRLTFTVDASLLMGQDAMTLQIFRDGLEIDDCTTPDGTATDDPCVASRATVDGDAQLVVLTSHASRWNFAVHVPYAFSGFFPPVDSGGVSSTPVLNKMQGGAAVPVRFSLGGNQGLSILASGSPSSRPIACDTGATIDPIETITNAVASGLTYHAGSGQYTYTWKTDKSWTSSCRRLTVRLIDGTTHTADFSFRK